MALPLAMWSGFAFRALSDKPLVDGNLRDLLAGHIEFGYSEASTAVT